MEFNNHPVTNTTEGWSDTAGGAQPTPFNWRNPTFLMPNPPARPTGANRVPGSVHSSRPRWTPAKHARILANIKATRTDTDPSFPRAVPVPEHAPPASTQAQVKAAVQGFVQSTQSYFFGLTEYAVDQLYGQPSPPASAQGAQGTGAASGMGTAGLAEQKAHFLQVLVNSGLSESQALDVVLAWTAARIPLNDWTLPANYKEKYVFKEADLALSASSRAHVLFHVEPSGVEKMLKCYPPASGVDPSGFSELTGIDPREPKSELRCLLASHIAHQLLGWDITPATSLAFVGARVCLLTPVIEGPTLKTALSNNLRMHQCFNTAWRDGALHTAVWKDEFTDGFREDYIRLSIFAMLIGDPDRHLDQFITQPRKPAFLKGVDWDKAFGSKILDDRIHPSLVTGQYRAVWVDSVPQKVADDFGKLNDIQLRTAARLFGMSEPEVAALISRFELVKTKLAAIKKT